MKCEQRENEDNIFLIISEVNTEKEAVIIVDNKLENIQLKII